MAGTVIAAVAGKADFSNVGDAALVAAPQPLYFGSPTFELGAIVAMTIVILVTLIETTADILTIGEILETDVDSRRVADGLRADMLSTAAAPIFGSFTCSAFAQNVGLVALTGIKSRFAVAAGGLILVLLGLLPVVGAIVAGIPYPVLGGAGLVLFGTVAASGIRTLARVDYKDNLNLIVVAVGIGFGLIPVAAPEFWHAFPSKIAVVLESGTSAAAVAAVLLNLVFNEWKFGKRQGASVLAAAADERDRLGERMDDDIHQ